MSAKKGGRGGKRGKRGMKSCRDLGGQTAAAKVAQSANEWLALNPKPKI
jgi:hypothetical protein